MEEGETVTWQAVHFGVLQRLTVKMTVLKRPNIFVDEMTDGAFSIMKHSHIFEEKEGGTEMHDRFEFEAPFGIIGRLLEMCVLKRYMRKFLIKRNRDLQEMAESQAWKEFLAG